MRPITRTEEPEKLKNYRLGNPKSTWKKLRDSDRNCLNEIYSALEKMQNNICAYCEIDLTMTDRQVEHFHPKSKKKRGYNPSLDWENMLYCCRGGSAVFTKTRKEEGRIFNPINENISCGQKKDNTVVDSKLSPAEWKFPLVRAVEISGELSADEALKDGEFFAKNIVEIVPSEENCKRAGIDTDKVQNFIEILNLNCKKLGEARGAHFDEIASKADATQDEEILSLFQEYLLPNHNGNLRRFWTTSRSFFGAAGERWYAAR